MYTIYEHITPSGKRYIGKTGQPIKRRWGNGCNYSNQRYFYSAIQKYSWKNIKHNILHSGLTEDEANVAEKFWIWWYNTTDRRFGYNNTFGGDGGSLGVTCSDETRRKLSVAMCGRALSDETRERISMSKVGKKLSKEHIEKLRASHKGKGHKLSESTKQKIGKANSRPVIMYSVEMEELSRFSSCTDAAKFMNCSVPTICRCCKDKVPTACGYVWRYDE